MCMDIENDKRTNEKKETYKTIQTPPNHMAYDDDDDDAADDDDNEDDVDGR